MKRCLMCFAQRSTDPYPGTAIELCRGCKYFVDKTIGFWETQGYGMQLVNLADAGKLDLNYQSPVPGEGEGETPLPPGGSAEDEPKPAKAPKDRKPDDNHR